LAARGAGLVLVARSRRTLEELAAAARVRDEVAARGLRVDVLVNNAGFGTNGPFHELSADRAHDEVTVNVAAVVDLAHVFLPAMVERRDGAVINVASTAAFQPTPCMAVYGASKAFVLSLSHALRAELRGSGVRMVALSTGATETAFFANAGDSAPVGAASSPSSVVRTALRTVDRDGSQAIPRIANAVLAQATRLAPRPLAARLVRDLTSAAPLRRG
jgi:uncharacterized protein